MAPIPSTSPERVTYNLINVVLILGILFYAQYVLVPLVFAGFFAILLIAPCKYFEKEGFPRLVAALILIILGILFFVVVFYFMYTQLITFKSDMPEMIKQMRGSILELETWLKKELETDAINIREIFDSATSQSLGSKSNLISTTFITISSTVFYMIMIPVYTFLMLLYRNLFVRFFVRIFSKEHASTVQDVLQQTRIVIKGYIVGLFIETVIVAVLNCVGFFILGVKYALLLGIVTALLKLIPYLGIAVGCLVTLLITLTTNSTATAVGALVVLVVVHLIDGNYVFPKIVGSKVRLNALASIVAVIVGSAMWGIPGMFLALPIVAILKVIFDSVEGMDQWGLILGDDPSLKETRGKALGRRFRKKMSK